MNGIYETNMYMQKFFLNSRKQHVFISLSMKQRAKELQAFVGYL